MVQSVMKDEGVSGNENRDPELEQLYRLVKTEIERPSLTWEDFTYAVIHYTLPACDVETDIMPKFWERYQSLLEGALDIAHDLEDNLFI